MGGEYVPGVSTHHKTGPEIQPVLSSRGTCQAALSVAGRHGRVRSHGSVVLAWKRAWSKAVGS